MTKNFLCTIAELTLLVLCLRCAGQVPPSGGPPDTTPPFITESYPQPNTLHFRDRKIDLKFSEYVDRSSVEQSVFFSPPVGALTFDWGGTDVEIRFSDSLRPKTTYIMTLGTDVVDRRNHNRMASAFALPFSTGDHIDSAAVTGRVFGGTREGIMIFAYRLDGLDPDTLDPRHTPPSYVTQTGSDGSYKLTNLAQGAYRLLAVGDQYKNFLYDPQVDEFGIASRSTVFRGDSTVIPGVNFRMAKEDTTPPFLSSARALDRDHLLLRFSESVDASTLKLGNISVADTLHGTPLPLSDLAWEDPAPAEVQAVTAPQESLLTYRVTVSAVRDPAGNVISPQSASAVWTGSAAPDTTKPTIDLVGIRDSARTIQPGDTLRCSFGEAVRRSSFEHGCTLSGPGGGRLTLAFQWHGSSSVVLLPAEPLEAGKWYLLRAVLDSLSDADGNGYRDSTWTRHFQLVQGKTLSSIAGVVRGEVRTKGALVLTASEISTRTAKSRQTVADSAGAFRFDNLPEGTYTLFAFCDADGNGSYSYGRPFPYQLAEQCSGAPDTLKVRARWPLEGVVVRIE